MCGRCAKRTATGAVRTPTIEGLLEPALLLLLHEGGGYGYTMAAQVTARQFMPGPVSPPRAYEALKRLEAAGAVESVYEASPDGPDRRRYSITHTGRLRLDRWAEALRLADRNLHAVLDTYDQHRLRPEEMDRMCCCNSKTESDRTPTTVAEEPRKNPTNEARARAGATVTEEAAAYADTGNCCSSDTRENE